MALTFTREGDYGLITDSTRGVILKTKALGTPYASSAENVIIYFSEISFTYGALLADISLIGGEAPADMSEAINLLAPIFAGVTPSVKVVVTGDCE